MSYLMWSQYWCLTDLRDIDRQVRKIVCESGGKHPLGLKATVCLPRALGGRGMTSVEEEYKMTEIKPAIKLYSNEDSTMSLVRKLEENAAHQGNQSLVKEARTLADELGPPLIRVSRTPNVVTIQMEQMYLEIKSRATSKRPHWSGGKLKLRKKDSKESSLQLDGRMTS